MTRSAEVVEEKFESLRLRGGAAGSVVEIRHRIALTSLGGRRLSIRAALQRPVAIDIRMCVDQLYEQRAAGPRLSVNHELCSHGFGRKTFLWNKSLRSGTST